MHHPVHEWLNFGNFHERKASRKAHYEKYVKGWKLVKCIACNGSGYYDWSRNGRVPKCGSCDGTGRARVSPDEYRRYQKMFPNEM